MGFHLESLCHHNKSAWIPIRIGLEYIELLVIRNLRDAHGKQLFINFMEID